MALIRLEDYVTAFSKYSVVKYMTCDIKLMLARARSALFFFFYFFLSISIRFHCDCVLFVCSFFMHWKTLFWLLFSIFFPFLFYFFPLFSTLRVTIIPNGECFVVNRFCSYCYNCWLCVCVYGVVWPFIGFLFYIRVSLLCQLHSMVSYFANGTTQTLVYWPLEAMC